MKLGLLGGSFNPVHLGHLHIASHAYDRLRLDRVLFVPTGDPPHKRDGSLAPSADRYEMVRLAIAGNPAFLLSDVEVRRPGKSYSIDTVRELMREYGPDTQLYFLIGLDAFLDFPTWRDPETLLKTCCFVVMSRPGQSYRSLTRVPLLPPLDPDALGRLDSDPAAELTIRIPAAPGIICLPAPPCQISASEIRDRVARGASLANWLPPQVESYILHHRLYQEDRDRTHI